MASLQRVSWGHVISIPWSMTGVPQRRYAAHVLNLWHVQGWMADMFAWLGVACFPFQGKAPQRQVAALRDIPVLFIHGAEDPLLPFEATLQVYDTKPGAKRLWLIPGVGHAQEPVLAQDAEYAAQLGEFFHGVLPPQIQPHVSNATITCNVVAQPDGAFTVQWRNPGPPGVVLLTIVHDTRVEFRTVWLSDEAAIPPIRHRPRQVSCLRLFTGTGCGDTARLCLSYRGQRYQEVFQPDIHSLSLLLHEGRLKELDTLLQALPQDRPRHHLTSFSGILCADHATDQTQTAAYCQDRCHGPFVWLLALRGQAVSRQLPTPWDLAAVILDTPVGPDSTPRQGERSNRTIAVTELWLNAPRCGPVFASAPRPARLRPRAGRVRPGDRPHQRRPRSAARSQTQCRQ